MSQLSKQDLKAENQLQFPNNNNGAITPADLRAFNVDMIDSTVNQTSFDSFSGSVAGQFASATGSVTSAITASSLITASFNNGTRNLTFTKGDASTFAVNIPDVSGSTLNTGSFATTASFNAYTQSNDQKVNSLIGATGSYAITGSNTFTGNQIISQGNGLSVVGGGGITLAQNLENSGSQYSQVSIFTDTATYQVDGLYAGFGIYDSNPNNPVGALVQIAANSYTSEFNGEAVGYIGGGNANLASSNTAIIFRTGSADMYIFKPTSFAYDVNITGSLTASLQQGYTWVGNANGKTTTVATSSFGSTINTGSFATTGSNTFRGIETFEDAGGNATSLVPRSGSLILVAKGYTSASAHLTSSANSFVNLIFKDNNFTSDTIISGSNNIFSNGDTPNTGFKKYVGSNNIFIPSGSVPQITGSTAYPLLINNNFSNRGTISVAGPISASASSIQFNFFGQNGVNIGAAGANNAEKLVGGFTFNTNLVLAGNPTIIANQNFITGSSTISNNQFITSPTIAVSSSAVAIQGNLFNASLNLRNAYWSSSVGLGSLTVARNIIQGSTQVITFTGSQPTGTTNAPQIADSQLMGTNLTTFVDVSGSDVAGTTANHSILSTMIQGYQMIITGSSAAASNNFGSAFIGRYNAQDGNRSKTAQTIFAVGTGNATTRKTGFLIDSGSNTFVEGTLNVSGSSTLSGSLYIQSGSTLPVSTGSAILTWNAATGQVNQASFSTIVSASVSSAEFWSTTTQSGSAGVSGSITFNNSGSFYNVSLVNGTQLRVANAGVYNIQFSAQIETSAGADTLYMWFKKNGTNISDSASKAKLANNTAQIMTVNILDEAAANDYYEIAYQNLNGNATVLAEVASGNIPAIPSVIATIIQVR